MIQGCIRTNYYRNGWILEIIFDYVYCDGIAWFPFQFWINWSYVVVILHGNEMQEVWVEKPMVWNGEMHKNGVDFVFQNKLGRLNYSVVAQSAEAVRTKFHLTDKK